VENLGDILRRVRVEKGHTLAETSSSLAIPVSILEALESGDHDRLPAPCFSQGFIRTYGEFLDLEPGPLMLLHKQESQEHRHPVSPDAQRLRKVPIRWSLPFPPQIAMQSELVSWLAIVAVILLAWVGYSSFVGPKGADPETAVQASTIDLRLERMKSTPTPGYRTNRDPAAVEND
jgi:cytoskeletal protein RodZ